MKLKQCFFLILLFHCTILATSKHRSLEARFFEFTAAQGPGGNLGAPVPTPIEVPVPAPSTQDPPSPPGTWSPAPSNVPPPPSGKSGSSGGLKGGQKAGIVMGTLAGAGLLVFGGMIYKTRRSNMKRERLASAARTPML
ncbi:hypothetical protein M5689_001630 [Euphorbia peplus]|nr:hypothetical protein M5689_001630 [Euphorbia peplus]